MTEYFENVIKLRGPDTGVWKEDKQCGVALARAISRLPCIMSKSRLNFDNSQEELDKTEYKGCVICDNDKYYTEPEPPDEYLKLLNVWIRGMMAYGVTPEVSSLHAQIVISKDKYSYYSYLFYIMRILNNFFSKSQNSSTV